MVRPSYAHQVSSPDLAPSAVPYHFSNLAGAYGVCVCVSSERQGRSLQLQLEQTTASHPAATTTTTTTSSRERPAGQTRHSRSKSVPRHRAAPYCHIHPQSRDKHLPPSNYYTPVPCYAADYYYGDYGSSSGACLMMEASDDQHTSGTLTTQYDCALYRDNCTARTAHSSSVIVHRQPNSCCQPPPPAAVAPQYHSDDYATANGSAAAGYTSVIVTMSADMQ